jgi:hypothetical protein
LVKLSPPVYPPLARTAEIGGAVVLELGIQKNGSIASFAVIRGHPLLVQAALDSAQHSQFECRGCSDEVTSYSLTYSFEFVTGAPSDDGEKKAFEVIQPGNWVRIIAGPLHVIADPDTPRVRSAKCLYVWRCGLRRR